MPIYSMRNTETQEEFEVTMKYSELQEYLEANSHIQQIFNRFPAYGDPIRMGVRKPDDGFREVLQKGKHAHKRSTINDF